MNKRTKQKYPQKANAGTCKTKMPNHECNQISKSITIEMQESNNLK